MTVALGIDVGGTRIAARAVDVTTGRLADVEVIPTSPQRGSDAVLRDVIALAHRHCSGTSVVGLGLGSDPRFFGLVERGIRPHLVPANLATIAILPAAMGGLSGLIGAAVCAASAALEPSSDTLKASPREVAADT